MNHISSKNGNLYKIKEEDIQLYSLNLKKPKIDINSSDLKLGNISIKEPNSKEKEEIIQDKIKGIDIKLKKGDDSKLNNPLKGPTKIRINSKNNKNSEKDNSERIKGMNEQINIGLSMPNFDIKSESLKGSNIKGSSNSNMQYNKTEVLTGTIYGSKNNNISKSNIIINKSEEGKNKQSKNESGLDKDSSHIKYIIEYGITKGYKRPKIKKGKDFVHKPEFRIEGTIQGTKKIPITLKSLFEDSNNKTIQLNHISSKNGNLYKIKEEDIQLYSLNLKKPKIDINSSDLKLGNISIKEPNSKEKEEIIQDKIKGIDIKLKKGDDSKLNNPLKGPTKIRINSKNNKNSEKDNSERIKGMNEQINIGLSMPNFDIKSESLKGSNIKGSSNSNMQYNKTEVLTGTIYGSKNNNISKSNIIINKSEEGKNKQSKNESGLDKDSSHIKYIIEYGITKGYKRPKIKKGKDFVHKPEFRIEGTIQGNKIIPITLKSIFEGKVKDSIKLNNDSLKNPIFKIKDENIKNITTINLDNHLKENNNVNIKLKSSNGLHSSNKNIVNDNIKYIIEYGSTKGYKRPNIKKGKDFVHEPEFRMEGTIQGSKIMDENIKNSYKNNNDKAQLTSSKTLYFIEYGATLNYKENKKKKGKDFYHEPKVKFIKNDSD